MRLTLQTDYALRVLLYTATRPEQWVSAQRLAEIYRVSAHHISKITKDLVARGYLRSRRGQAGGVQIAVEPAQLTLGALLRELEGPMELLDCFDPQSRGCLLAPSCSLRHALMRAQRAFLAELDGTTLADLVGDRGRLEVLFNRREANLDAEKAGE